MTPFLSPHGARLPAGAVFVCLRARHCLPLLRRLFRYLVHLLRRFQHLLLIVLDDEGLLRRGLAGGEEENENEGEYAAFSFQ